MTTLKDYRFESVRLASFKDWPCCSVKPKQLAAAGFFYTGKDDKVKCFACRVELCQWRKGDNPMTDHQRWSEKCKFICRIPCGNVPIGTDPSTILAPVPKGVDICGLCGSIYMPYSGPEHEVLEDKEERGNYWLKLLQYQRILAPKHLEYSSYDARSASYKNWPKVTPQAEELTTAGFFYLGNSDHTVCYYCGGKIKDWESNDDPWIEHAKYFSSCFYVILIKGTEFVSDVTGTKYVKIKYTPSAIDAVEEKFTKVDIEEASGVSRQEGTDEVDRKEQSVQTDNVTNI